MKKIILLLLTFNFSLFTVKAQDQHLVDSLETSLKNHNASKLGLKIKSPALFDSTAANILADISAAYWGNNAEKGNEYAKQCLALSEQIGYKSGIGRSYHSMGVIQFNKSNYLLALEFYKKALKNSEEAGDKNGIATTYNSMGTVYNYMGNLPEAMKYQLTCLKLFEEIGNKKGIATAYNNIGLIYTDQSNRTEALKNYTAALKIFEEIRYKKGIISAYINIGRSNMGIGNFPEALKNNFAVIKVAEEIGDKNSIAIAYGNIGHTYAFQDNYPDALKYYFSSLKIREELGNEEGVAITSINIGRVNFKTNNPKEAKVWLLKGLNIAKEIEANKILEYGYRVLSRTDSALGNFKDAYDNYKLSIMYHDSILNTDNTKKTVALQMNYDFSKKQDSLNIVQASKDIVGQKELQKQKLVRNGFIGGTILFLLLAGAIFIGFRKTRKEKKKSEELLLNILPAEVAEELKSTGSAKAKSFTMVTVMFTDFKDFTTVSEKVSAELLVAEIHYCFSAFDGILQKYKIEKIKTIGDAYLCASGLPISNYTHANDMLNAAFEIRNFMKSRKENKEAKGEIPFELRIGIHTGAVVAGIVGVKKYAYDIWGDTVNIAARMEQNSEAGKINISGSTYELVKDKFKCEHRGKIQAKHKGEIDMYFIEPVS